MGFRHFVEMKRLFSFTPEAGSHGEVAGHFHVENRATDVAFGSDGRWASVCHLTLGGALPVSLHQTH
jgi:hypothetical protein